MAAAQAAWPDVVIAPGPFSEFLTKTSKSAGRLDGARATDLYLVCACVRGDPAAVRALDAAFFPRLRGALLRRGMGQDVVDEALQRTREKLFVGQGGSTGKIAEYTGESSLFVWLRVVATRVAIDIVRSRRPSQGEDELAQVPTGGADPELAHLKQRYGAEFRAALQEAARDLSADERNLLRQHYVDGLTMESLAALHGVHRVTMVRRVTAAREKLGASTRKALLQRFRLGAKELDSIIAVVQSRLGVSLNTLFASSRTRRGA